MNSTASIISRFVTVHGDKYDYGKFKYTKLSAKVVITCKVHGDFEQMVATHLRGSGCVKCANAAKCNTLEDVLKKCESVHNGKFDYSLIKNYTTGKTKVAIICPIHGEFMQQLQSHSAGVGCRLCADMDLSVVHTLTTTKVLEQFEAVHGRKYDYSQVHYVDDSTNVEIVCKEHGIFKQTPSNHKSGKGCSACAVYGFNALRPAILYYLKVVNLGVTAYKIGITNKTVAERFGSDMQFITILKEWEYQVGADAHKAEQTILQLNREHKYKGPPLLRSGNTELFSTDIGGFDE